MVYPTPTYACVACIGVSMTKLSIVHSAKPASGFVANVNASVINVSIDTKEVVSAYTQVFAKNYGKAYTAKRNARVPLNFDISKF